MVQWTLAELHKDFIQWEATDAFIMKVTEQNSTSPRMMTYLSA
jgi:hypothetical protein